jgi:hypothetical protein
MRRARRVTIRSDRGRLSKTPGRDSDGEEGVTTARSLSSNTEVAPMIPDQRDRKRFRHFETQLLERLYEAAQRECRHAAGEGCPSTVPRRQRSRLRRIGLISGFVDIHGREVGH